ncbi:hypothetical protein QQM39_09755 [Streptomyces sp. DT2A-34]|uniref:hypothetical protein n=1 Tax=Streptomyces sp. DT2A-34 TaxID=3051182 RepID=UPI00265C3411|nr:hypothetical protein [Streptomyces sp. DT2A-34]MDO0911127.1 hypothetical protein [Streptomyces sp. DT2A-34]
MSRALGRDGCPLVTVQAAYLVGMKPDRSAPGASRHYVRPAQHQPDPKRGQALANLRGDSS